MFLQAYATSCSAEDWFLFRMPGFMLEMFAGLKMLCGLSFVMTNLPYDSRLWVRYLTFQDKYAVYRLAVELLALHEGCAQL
ncbi:hypothetical protein DY000_02048346 [Brassica cretica]|uniref:Uncharacterized protein n=1 Tax=Brassica cretica TaxID=69181 RepID=A0ABQ7EYW0_BRACR|nr:hypothetical protein DY000_02048346 [Brassica cretica]